MKKTQLKDCLRNIWRQRVSFLSIIVIAALGVTTFLGISFSADGLRKNASDLYNRLNFRDVEVISTLLLSEDDVEALRGVEGVVAVEPVRATSASAIYGEKSVAVDVVSKTEQINRAEITEGRLPTGDDECALEEHLAKSLGLQLGDRVSLLGQTGGTADYMRQSEFTLTGIVHHPDHINTLVPDLPYAIVTLTAFDTAALGDCYMKAEVVIQKAENSNRFSKSYEKNVATVLERIETLALSRVTIRDEQLKGAAQAKVDDAAAQLNSGFEQLEAAKATIREKIREVFERAFPGDTESKLITWAASQVANADDSDLTASYLWITKNIRIDLSRSFDDILHTVFYAESIPEKFLVALYEWKIGNTAPRDAAGNYDLAAIREAMVGVVSEQASDYRQLSDACAQWNAGHSTYLNALQTYQQAMVKWDPCRWICLDTKGNASFVQLYTATDNFSSLKVSFSMLFVLVGALVIFATIGKMVDEQRSLVGTTKALGFFNREIFAKYLVFGVCATLTGTVLGVLFARFGIEPLMLGGFARYYRCNVAAPFFDLASTAVALTAGVLLAVSAIWLACSRLLREPAIRLMQGKMPEAKKTSQKRGKRVLSLYSRLILLNMRTDLKRVIVTIVSVAGCCALVVIGFTLRSAIAGAVTQQYENIVAYDVSVKYDAASDSAAEEIKTTLQTVGADYTAVYRTNATYRIDNLQVADLFCGNIAEIGTFYHLTDWKTGEPLAPTDRGVLITRRFAEIYHLNTGSEFDLALGGIKTATVRVAGVFETYIGRTVVMSETYYEKTFGEPLQANTFLVRLNGADAQGLDAALQAVNGYRSMARADEDRSVIETSMSLVNLIVVLFIFIAALMAAVVQLNLTNMYIQQKKCELVIMRVNGFTVREVIAYVLRETVLTTILGILLGIAAGAGFAYVILRAMEQIFLRFVRTVNLPAWLIGAAITLIFTVAVNAIALRKTRNLKLTDAA